MNHPFIAVSHLLTIGRPPDCVVSSDKGQAVDWTTFTAHVGRLNAILTARDSERWLIFTENTYAFAVALLAVWHAGGVAVIAPNGHRGTLSALSAGARGLITDISPDIGPTNHVSPIQHTGFIERRWTPLDRTIPVMELVTSGSTGTAKSVPKTLAHLEDEVAGLEGQWGQRLQGRQIFATVSHQHIYGLLFRVLWPLSAGRIFRAHTDTYPDQIASQTGKYGRGALVASPAHLSRLKNAPSIETLSECCPTVFSSGSPLDRSTAVALRQALGIAPFEIFGSTETGGVAWRQQDGTDGSDVWTPFPRVTVTHDDGNLLRVRSPFVSEANREFTMADQAEFLADGRFILGVRNDRTVKLGDKRLSLPEMEAALRQHAFVAAVALVVLEDGVRARLGAVIVPTAAGRKTLTTEGRRAVSQALLALLEPYWDRVLLPKAWRYVDRMPEDAQGKVTVSGLRALFTSHYDPAVTTPELLAETSSSNARRQTLRVPDTLGFLDGHFPDQPIVPGAVQIQWAVDVARALTGNDVRIERLEALKFKDTLHPGDVFQLSVEMPGRGDRFVFRLWNDKSIFSSGRCILTQGLPGDS